MATLRLGKVDSGSMPQDKMTFLARFHATMSKALREKMAFRDEGDGRWRNFEVIEGNNVTALQEFLRDAGFKPRGDIDGVFGYVTHAAVRLFQEYIRTVDGDDSIGTPDGVVGRNTFRFIDKWKAERTGTPAFVCKWGRSTSENGTEEFNKWIALMEKAKNHYIQESHPFLKLMDKLSFKSDTKNIVDWDTSKETVHLIGIRRNQEKAALKEKMTTYLFY